MAPIITAEWNEVPANVRAGADHLLRSICKSPAAHLAEKDTPYKFVYRYRASLSDPNVVRFQMQILVNGKGICLGYVTDARVGALLVSAALLDSGLHMRDRLHGWFYTMMHDSEIRNSWVAAIGTRQLPQDLPPRIPNATPSAKAPKTATRREGSPPDEPESRTDQTPLRITFQPLDAEVPENLKCPLRKTLMRNPVRWEDGNVYDEDALREWLRGLAVENPSHEDSLRKKFLPCWETREKIASFRLEYYNAAKKEASPPPAPRKRMKRPSPLARKENGLRNVVPKTTKGASHLDEMMRNVFEKCFTVGMYNATFNTHYGRIMSRFLSVVDMHERLKEVGGATGYPFHDSSHLEGGRALAQWIRYHFSAQIEEGRVEEIRGAHVRFSGFRPTTASSLTVFP